MSNQCDANGFNTSTRIGCTEFIYATDEINVQTEFNIHCEDSYKLALIGSANTIGRFIFLPITGILSDKFGRLRVVLISMLCCSVFGLIKSFSIDYAMYIVLEFLEGTANTCIYCGFFVLAIEWVSSRYRALGIALIGTTFSLGEMLLGFLAMYIHNFRYLLRVLYAPGLLVVFYFWLVPESVRWLLITGRIDRAIKTLQRIARVNGKTLSEKSIEVLRLQYPSGAKQNSHLSNEEKNGENLSIFQQMKLVVASRKLGLRLLNCGYLWATCCFCFYGLSLISTHIPGANRYLSFIIVIAVEIPGAILGAMSTNKFGRKNLLFYSLTLSGVSILIAPWIPKDKSLIVLILFMLGKSSITFAFKVVYVFTAELYPTNIRGTIMNSCSMIGRIGAVLATFNGHLMAKHPIVPFLLFGTSAIVGAVLVLLNPETYGKKLPDTIKEAKDL
ncbi:organic cation transporter-like protein isoform X2 [Contarinia nasturtii]|nr:organic cation transporter-like protein isoform X2 [Contarinia nasturtii]